MRVLELIYKVTGAEAAARAAADVDAAVDRTAQRGRESEDAYKRLGAQFDTFGRKAISVGSQLTLGVTAPLAGIATGALMAGTQFEKTMNAINGVMTPTTAQMGKLREMAMKMGNETVFSASEAGQALLELGKAGLSVDQSLSSVDKVMQLAAASGLSMGRAAEMSARTIKMFGLEVEDLGHVNDVLTTAVNASTLELTDLETAFKYIGNLAPSIGLSLENVAAALALMRDKGIAAETSGRALREGLGRLLNPTKAVHLGLEQLGLTIENLRTADGHLKPLAEVIDILNTKGLDAGTSLKIFGNAAGPGMLALVESGRPALDAMTAQLVAADGSAKRMADTMMQGLPGALERLKGAVETSLIRIMEIATPMVVTFMGAVVRVHDVFMALPGPIQTALVVFGGLAAVIGPLLVMAGTMAMSWGALIEIFPALAVGTGVVTTAIGGLVWPLTATVAAVIAVYEAWQHWDDIVAFFSGAWSVVSDAIQGVPDWLLTLLGPIGMVVLAFKHWDEIAAVVGPLLTSVGEMFGALADLIGAVVGKVVGYVADMVAQFTHYLVDLLRPVWEPVVAGVRAVVGAFASAVSTVVGYAQAIYAGIKTYLLDRFVAIVDGVKGKVDAVTGFFRDMYDKVVGHSYVPDMVTGIGTEFGKLQSLMVTPAVAAADQVTRVMQSMYDKVKAIPTHQLFDVIPESLRDDPRVMLQGSKDQDRLRALAMGLGAPSVAAHGAPGAVQGSGVGDAFSGAFSTIGPSILKAIQGGGNVLQSAGSAFGLSVTKQLFDEGSPASNLIGKGVSKLFGTSGLGKMITESIGSFLPGVGALVGPLVGKLGSVIKGMFGPDAKELEGRQGAGDFKTQIQSQLTELQKIEVAHANVTGAMQQQVALHIKIRDAVIATGVDQETATQRATAMVDQLWRAEKNGGAAVKTVIEQINGVIESGTTAAVAAAGDAAVNAIQSVTSASVGAADQMRATWSKFGFSAGGSGGGGGSTGDESVSQSFVPGQSIAAFARANGIADLTSGRYGMSFNNEADRAKAQNEVANWIADHPGMVEQAQQDQRDRGNVPLYMGFATGGLVPQYLAWGGRALSRWARGTDTVPAMLTPGEFVMNAQATQRNLGTLQSMNRGGGGGVSISIGSIAVDSGMTEAEFGRKAVAALTGEMRRRGVKFA